MNRDEQVKTLVAKYGSIAVSRFYIRGIRSALSNIRNGVETNNIALMAKDVGLLADNLANLESVYGIGKEALAPIQTLDKHIK